MSWHLQDQQPPSQVEIILFVLRHCGNEGPNPSGDQIKRWSFPWSRKNNQFISCREGEGPSHKAMNVLSQNVRGLNALNKNLLFKCCISTTKENIIILQETNLTKEDMGKFKQYLGWQEIREPFVEGALGGLTILLGLRNISISS